jgi:uncharacterized protein YndB with AHSA1/START domain
VSSARITRHIRAPRAAVYRALLDPDAIARWRVPDGMSSTVHEFDAREGGAFRVSLTYDAPTDTGKSGEQTDTYHGRFIRLVSDAEVVEVLEFETDDPQIQGEMKMTTTLAERDAGTDVTVVHEGVPPGVPPADNELGTRMALDNLAALVESRNATSSRPRRGDPRSAIDEPCGSERGL